MLDMKFVRENPDAVKENIKKKFQDAKLPLVDEVIALDAQRRANIQEADQLRADRNRLSKQVGMLMGQAKKDPSKLAEAEAVKKQVTDEAERLADEGQFGKGSMEPKVRAAIKFARSRKGRTCIIGALDKAAETMAGLSGTRIHE